MNGPSNLEALTAFQFSDSCFAWDELKSLIAKRPNVDSSTSILDEYYLRMQNIFMKLITEYPVFSVEHKLELHMWNILYKDQVTYLQTSLHKKMSGTIASDISCVNIGEYKLRLVLLLDRASGVYFTLIHRLLYSIPHSNWPKAILNPTYLPTGFECTTMKSHDFMDLDTATLSTLNKCKYRFNNTWSRSNVSAISTTTSTNGSISNNESIRPIPRILSRGTRLPELTNHLTDIGTDKPTDEPESPHLQKTLGTANTHTSIDQDSATIYLIHHCLIHLGDVARYRQQSNVAAGYYIWAWVVHPDSGHSYNQLAILEASKSSTKRRLDVLFYYYIRAIACNHPFPVAINNLTNLLKDNLYGYKQRSTETNIPSNNNSNNNNNNNNNSNAVLEQGNRNSFSCNEQLKLFIRLYATFQLNPRSSELIVLTNQLLEYMHDWDIVNFDTNEIIRILCLHFYYLHHCYNFENDVSRFVSDDGSPYENKSQMGAALLTSLTIHMINWFARVYMKMNAHSSSVGTKHDNLVNQSPVNENNLLIGLNLLFLWLRAYSPFPNHEQSDKKIQFLRNKHFLLTAPQLSEDVVLLLNEIFAKYRSKWKAVITDVDVDHVRLKTLFDDTVYQDASHDLLEPSADTISANIHWARLMRVPEILLLQGFVPLSVPSQHTLLKSSQAYDPVGLILVSNPFSTLFDYTSVFCNFYQMDSLVDNQTERLLCLFLSAYCVTHSFPALLNWCMTNSSEKGPFYFVSRPTPEMEHLINNLDESINQSEFNNSATNRMNVELSQLQLQPVREQKRIKTTFSSVETLADVKPTHQLVPKQFEYAAYAGMHNEVAQKLPDERSSVSGHSLSVDQNQVVYSPVKEDTITVLKECDLSHSINVNDTDVLNKSLPSSSEVIKVTVSNTIIESNSSVSITTTVSSASTATAGGLIVNAELAKFIQEQASQVAARQQRIGLSSPKQNIPNSRDQSSIVKNSPSKHSTPSQIQTNFAFVPINTTRLSLSGAFRRDLPPRFAKRLQAELMEREANELCKNHSKQVNDALMSFDQPAPLARKESEAPVDLNLLLSTSLPQTTALPVTVDTNLLSTYTPINSEFNANQPTYLYSTMNDLSKNDYLNNYRPNSTSHLPCSNLLGVQRSPSFSNLEYSLKYANNQTALPDTCNYLQSSIVPVQPLLPALSHSLPMHPYGSTSWVPPIYSSDIDPPFSQSLQPTISTTSTMINTYSYPADRSEWVKHSTADYFFPGSPVSQIRSGSDYSFGTNSVVYNTEYCPNDQLPTSVPLGHVNCWERVNI